MSYKLGEVIYGIEKLDNGETDIRGELFWQSVEIIFYALANM